MCVEPPLHHIAAGLVLEERRSRRECNRSKSGKSFLEYLTPVTLGSRAHGSSCDACLAWRTSCAEQEWDRLKQECDRLKPVLLWQDAVDLREATCWGGGRRKLDERMHFRPSEVGSSAGRQRRKCIAKETSAAGDQCG